MQSILAASKGNFGGRRKSTLDLTRNRLGGLAKANSFTEQQQQQQQQPDAPQAKARARLRKASIAALMAGKVAAGAKNKQQEKPGDSMKNANSETEQNIIEMHTTGSIDHLEGKTDNSVMKSTEGTQKAALETDASEQRAQREVNDDVVPPATSARKVQANVASNTNVSATKNSFARNRRSSAVVVKVGGKEYTVPTDEDIEYARQNSMLFFPDSPFKSAWDWALFVLVLFVAVETPFEFSFMTSIPQWLVVANWLITFVFAVDIIFSFRTVPVLEGGVMLIEQSQIRTHYLKSTFIIDFVSVIPFEVVQDFFESDRDLSVLSVLKVIRLLRLGRLIRKTESLAAGDQFRLLKLLAVYMLLAHWFGCALFFIGKFQTETSEDGAFPWIYGAEISEAETRRQWITSVHYALTTISSVGYGAISPETNTERLFDLFTMFSGSVLSALIFGNVAVLISKMGSTNEAKTDLLRDIRIIGRQYELPKELLRLAEKTIDLKQTRDLSITSEGWDDLMSVLPHSMVLSILWHVHGPKLENCELVQALHSPILKELLPGMQIMNAARGQTILEQGEYVRAIIIVTSGKVKLTNQDKGRLSPVLSAANRGKNKIVFPTQNDDPSVKLVRAGALIGLETFVYGGEQPCSAIAWTDVEYLKLPHSFVLGIHEQKPMVYTQLMQCLTPIAAANLRSWGVQAPTQTLDDTLLNIPTPGASNSPPIEQDLFSTAGDNKNMPAESLEDVKEQLKVDALNRKEFQHSVINRISAIEDTLQSLRVTIVALTEAQKASIQPNSSSPLEGLQSPAVQISNSDTAKSIVNATTEHDDASNAILEYKQGQRAAIPLDQTFAHSQTDVRHPANKSSMSSPVISRVRPASAHPLLPSAQRADVPIQSWQLPEVHRNGNIQYAGHGAPPGIGNQINLAGAASSGGTIAQQFPLSVYSQPHQQQFAGQHPAWYNPHAAVRGLK